MDTTRVLERTSAGLARGRRYLPDGFSVWAGIIAFAAAFLILYPLTRTFLRLFVQDGVLDLSAFRAALEQPRLGQLLLNTFAVIAASTTLAILIGCTFAWMNERTDARMGWITDILPIVPLLVPPIAGAIGWVLLASPRPGYLNVLVRPLLEPFGFEGNEGPFNIFNWYGLVFIYMLYLVPHVYLTVSAGLRNLDPALEEASHVSGGGHIRTLRKVTLPAIKPAIIAGGLLALIIAFALFSVPVVVGSQAGIEVLAVRIVRLMTYSFPPQIDVAVALGVIMIIVIGGGWWLQIRVLRAARHATIGGKASQATLIQLGPWRWVARSTMVLYLLATSVLPLIALLIVSTQPFWTANINWEAMSLDHYRTVLFETRRLQESVRNSLGLGVVGATVGMMIAAVIGYLIQNRRGTLVNTLDATTKLPGAVSNIVIGIAFVAAFAGPPFRLHGTILLLFLAYIVLYMPQATFSANASLAQIGGELSEASFVSGASTSKTFFRITIPLMIPGLVGGWALIFVLMAGDITASSMLAGTRNPVVGFVILDLWVSGGTFPVLAAVATIISVISSTVVLTTLWLSKRGRFARQSR